MKMQLNRLGIFGCLVLCISNMLAAEPLAEQVTIPVEVDTTDPTLVKIVLIAGKPSHNRGEHEMFAGCVVLSKLLQQTPGVFPVIVRDEWPKNEKIFENARSIVFFVDQIYDHAKFPPGRMEVLKKAMDAGSGMVAFHYGLHYPKEEGEQAMQWLGGYYDWSISNKGHWTANVTPGEHPIWRGVQAAKWEDGWHFNFRFVDGMKGITPLLVSAAPDKIRTTADAKQHLGREEVLAWAYERPSGGRGFAFSGLHLHSEWADANHRKFLTNGILWSAKVDVPQEGAKVELDPVELKNWLDNKATPKK